MPKVPVKGCPKGYTNINGNCVADITPPLPRAAPEEESDVQEESEENEG